MLNIVVERKKESYDFKANPKKPSGFDNNYKNNMIDWLCLYDDNAEIARFHCQSVANYCFGDYKSNGPTEYGDTVAEGSFLLKLFVDPRNFYGEIHGIIQTEDIDGQRIDRESMQRTDDGYQTGRWLLHSTYSKKLGHDTNYAWSAGCIITSSADLEEFNKLLKAYNCKAGDTLYGQIVELV